MIPIEYTVIVSGNRVLISVEVLGFLPTSAIQVIQRRPAVALSSLTKGVAVNILQFRDIIGADRGFRVAADVVTQTIDGVNLNTIWNEFQQALDVWNRDHQLIAELFTFGTVADHDTLPLDGGTFDFEDASEFGVPKAGRAEPKGYIVGFPLDWKDAATRYTMAFLRAADKQQVDNDFAAAVNADRRLLFRSTLSALTSPSVLGSRETNEKGFSIYSLYAGSSDDIPPTFAGRTFNPGHNHYLVSGAASVDGGDLRDLTEHIQHHGHGLPINGERVIIMVNPQEGAIIRGLRRDPDSPMTAPYDFIPSVTAPAYLTDQTIVGDKAPAEFEGLPIIGSYGDAWVFESYYIPAGYVLAVGTAGKNSLRNPLAFRERPTAEQRGLRLLPGRNSYPLVESYYQRGFGVGVRNRGAAAVMQIKASGSFDTPTWP